MIDEAAKPEVPGTGEDPDLEPTERGFRESDPGTTPPEAACSGSRPERVGPYRILAELGQGGMGVVYLAEQTEPVRRRVALKMVRQDAASDVLLVRFEAERHAMARLRHPNVAQLYEASATEEGQPYFVMELVEGLPITKYCDARQLGLAERIDLFRRVCGAVQHAHEKGLLHRDLKPANILVAEEGGKGVPKVLDFGVAKAIDQPLGDGDPSDLQRFETRISGTPGYLAPEAIQPETRADLDTRSDVYSLGVVLYQLLVGVRPFETRGLPFAEIVQRVRDEEPTGPSSRWTGIGDERRVRLAESRRHDPASLPRQLRGDLDWIVLKAIAKDRRRRYGSPAELSADLLRHLRHEPVEAGPSSPAYRTRKFVRRHRGMVVAAATILASLLLGLTGTLVNLDRARREAAAAREALAEMEEISDFLQGLFRVSDPGEARGNSITARELLDRGAEQIRSGFRDRPLSRARLMLVMGKVYRELGLYDQAEPLLEETRSLREGEPDTGDVELGEADYELGWLYERQGRYDEAELLLRAALDQLREALGPDDPTVAEAVNGLASLYWDQGRYDEAEPLYRRALEIREKALGSDHPDVALTVGNLGALTWRQGRLEEAETHYRRAIEIWEESLGPDHPHIAQSLNGLGAVLWSAKRLDETEAAWKRAAEISEKALGPDHPELARIVHNLGVLHEVSGDLQEAESAYLRAIAIREKALGSRHPALGVGFKNLGVVSRKQGNPAQAEERLLRALELYAAGLDREDPRILSALKELADLYLELGRLEEAEPSYRRAVAGLVAGLPANRDKLADAWSGLAELLRATGRTEEAEEIEASALALEEESLRTPEGR